MKEKRFAVLPGLSCASNVALVKHKLNWNEYICELKPMRYFRSRGESYRRTIFTILSTINSSWPLVVMVIGEALCGRAGLTSAIACGRHSGRTISDSGQKWWLADKHNKVSPLLDSSWAFTRSGFPGDDSSGAGIAFTPPVGLC